MISFNITFRRLQRTLLKWPWWIANEPWAEYINDDHRSPGKLRWYSYYKLSWFNPENAQNVPEYIRNVNYWLTLVIVDITLINSYQFLRKTWKKPWKSLIKTEKWYENSGKSCLNLTGRFEMWGTIHPRPCFGHSFCGLQVCKFGKYTVSQVNNINILMSRTECFSITSRLVYITILFLNI